MTILSPDEQLLKAVVEIIKADQTDISVGDRNINITISNEALGGGATINYGTISQEN